MFLKENLAHAHVLIYGILVVVVILFMPDGVLGFFHGLANRRAMRLARAAGQEAPVSAPSSRSSRSASSSAAWPPTPTSPSPWSRG